jgi:hypothetical protein
MSHLLDAGEIVSAYDVGAGLDGDEVRALRSRLIEVGVEGGGPLRARMLARQLRARDDAPHAAFAWLLTASEAAREREIAIADLVAVRTAVDHPRIVRALVRQLLPDAAPEDRRVIDAAVALTDDPILRADLPPLSSLPARPRPELDAVWVEVDSTDRGQLPVHDVRMLPDGRLLVAVAGVGVRVVKPSGRIEAEFDVPADALIPSDTGLRVLALRGLGNGVVGMTAIAIPERRTRPLGEIAATVWADTFDGAQWFVGNHTQLWMLDMLADGPVALWQQTEHREPIVAISREAEQLAVASIGSAVGEGGVRPLTWVRRYRLPNLVAVDAHQDVYGPGYTLLANGEIVAGDVADRIYRAHVEVSESGPLTVVATKEGIEAPTAIIRLGGTTRPRVRIDNGSLLVADDLGRVEMIDLASGARRAHRITV